jgi:aminopeptidase N
MNFQEAMNILGELRAFLALIQSPEARWDAVQKWLDENPRWRSKLTRYLSLAPDVAVKDLKGYIRARTGVPQEMLALAVTPDIEAQAKCAIEKLQTLYRERAQLTERNLSNA